MQVYDAHIHLWDLEKLSISWLNERLKRSFSYNDLRTEYEGYELKGGLYVDVNADDLKEEAKFALNLRDKFSLDLCLADLENKDKICAFRRVLHTDEMGAKRLFEADFKKLLRECENSNLVFEACMKENEIELLQSVLQAHSKLKIVLNHCGNLDLNKLNEYESVLSKLSKFDNLYIKLSAQDNFSKATPKQDIFALLRLIKRYFNEDRLLYGSNFPVSSLAPKQWLNLIVESGVFEDLEAVFYKNALKVYKEN